MANGIELSLSYFGKKIIMRDNSPVLHAGELYNMFKSMIVSEFGEDTWDNLNKVQDEPKEYSFEDVRSNMIEKYGHIKWCTFLSDVIDITEQMETHENQ
jgi:hypothetical protein